MKKLLSIFCFIFLWNAFPQDLFACSCSQEAFEKASKEAPLVFTGVVEKVETLENSKDVKILFRIEKISYSCASRSFRSLVFENESLQLAVFSPFSPCQFIPSVNQRYKIAADWMEWAYREYRLTTDLCTMRFIDEPETNPETMTETMLKDIGTCKKHPSLNMQYDF